MGHDDMKSILSSTCRDVVGGSCYMDEEAVKGPDLATGAGFVDAYAACQLAAAGLSSGDS